MKNLFSKYALISDFHFFTLTAVIWAGLLQPFQVAAPLQLVFILSAGILSLAILRIFESVDGGTMGPRFTNVLLMTVAFTTGSLAAGIGVRVMLGEAVSGSVNALLLRAVPVAIAVFTACRVASLLMLRFDRKKNVVLYLTPSQRATFLDDLGALKVDDYLRYLDHDDLRARMELDDLRDVDMIVISKEAADFKRDPILIRAHLAGVPICDLRTVTTQMIGHVRLNEIDLATFLVEASPKTLLRRMLLQIKYLMEPVAAVAMMIVLAPAIVFVALLIKLTSPNGPVFYRQVRLGYLGRSFELIKFRTMVTDAESNGPRWASRQDPRVTPLGKFLRRTRLDELPQLWNVFRGDMGFIGPRPERPEIYEQLKEEVPLFHLRTLVRPGITGWAQVCAGYAASAEESSLKLEYDLFYIQHMSLRFDLQILLRTLKTVFVGDRLPVRTEALRPSSLGIQTTH